MKEKKLSKKERAEIQAEVKAELDKLHARYVAFENEPAEEFSAGTYSSARMLFGMNGPKVSTGGGHN